MNPLRTPAPPNSNGGATGAPSHVRIYRVWKGSNKFFLEGRLIFGLDMEYNSRQYFF
ncbi:unnamed protein product [Lupinus luteus]|uniref:Uncharacterized protein n=1 Tax=Lupinus luteus TaxID=3873 RepID=A0AAV1Y2K6_LUPLU